MVSEYRVRFEGEDYAKVGVLLCICRCVFCSVCVALCVAVYMSLCVLLCVCCCVCCCRESKYLLPLSECPLLSSLFHLCICLVSYSFCASCQCVHGHLWCDISLWLYVCILSVICCHVCLSYRLRFAWGFLLFVPAILPLLITALCNAYWCMVALCAFNLVSPLPLYSSPLCASIFPLSLSLSEVPSGHWWYSFFGNVLGTADQSPAPYTAFSYEGDSDVLDPIPMWRIANEPKVKQTLIRHGNFDYLTYNVTYEPAIERRDMPNSFYLLEKPAFMSGLTWPWVTADKATKVHGILPARARFDAIHGTG